MQWVEAVICMERFVIFCPEKYNESAAVQM